MNPSQLRSRFALLLGLALLIPLPSLTQTFTLITTGPIVTDGGYSTSAAWGDYNGDGNLDLFVSNTGFNFLYANNGDGTFTKVTTGHVVTTGGSSWGASWGDYDNDGDLDLFVANLGQSNFLYNNNGDGTFTKVDSGSIITSEDSNVGGTWGDYDNDGDLDLFVANHGNNLLYRNKGDGSFDEVADSPVVSDGGTTEGGAVGGTTTTMASWICLSPTPSNTVKTTACIITKVTAPFQKFCLATS